MKNVIIRLFAGLLLLGLTACASSGINNTQEINTTKQLQFTAVSFEFSQLVTPDIAYHTPKELEAILNEKIISLLQERNLLSKEKSMNTLNVYVTYQRRFSGDETPIPSDSLAYPHFDYQIFILDGSKVLAGDVKKDLTYKGGMMMNMQVIGLALRDKKYEVEFIEAIANNIVENIAKMKKFGGNVLVSEP